MSQRSPWQEHSVGTVFSAKFWRDCARSARNYTEDAVEHILVACILYLTVCFVWYVLITRWNTMQFQNDIKNATRVLIITAHPDDECMFFGPTIHNFVKRNDCLIYLMCMTRGGDQKTRKNELYEACKVLGIDQGCVILQNHSLLPDSMTARWPTELVAHLILKQIEMYNIDTLITFDKHGVSRHPNHSSIYYAVAHLSIERSLPKMCRVYVLESVNILRKYWLILDIPLSFLLSRYRYVLTRDERNVVIIAMKKHKSQMIWFRKLYLLFSRYTIINTLQQMDVSDIELDLEIDD